MFNVKKNLGTVKDKVSAFYSDHYDAISTMGISAFVILISYVVAIPYLLICKKLGLLNTNK